MNKIKKLSVCFVKTSMFLILLLMAIVVGAETPDTFTWVGGG